MSKLILISLTVLLMAGCTTKSLYYWGDYSHTAYQYEIEPSEATHQQHQQMLLEIIAKSEQKKIRVAPGIFAELGLLASQNNQVDQAISYYQQEAKSYPESQKLMEYLIKQLKGLNDA